MKTFSTKCWFLLLFSCTALLIISGCKKNETETPSNPTVKDADGNTYSTVTIGSQVWMQANLKATKYNDGTPIPLITDGGAWGAATTPAYCWMDNDQQKFGTVYGALYNWYAVNTGKLCPSGWHVASDAEWTALTSFLGGGDVAGGKLKETGTKHWLSPNTGATNESGFTALPGGDRYYDGTWDGIYGFADFWTSGDNGFFAVRRSLSYENDNVTSGYFEKRAGFSVRCIKD